MASATDILDILDACGTDFFFPMLDHGYVYLAATRMSLHRSPADWAMVIEVFGYNPRAGVPDVVTYTFGSTLRDRGEPGKGRDPPKHDEYDSFFPLSDGDWLDLDYVAENATEVELRGRRVPLPAREDYARHGIELQDPQRVWVHELCRFLADVARDEVLATADERRAHVPLALEQILVLEDWTHPDLAARQSPSEVETFRQLAHVLETGDTSHYRPMTAPNTHWKHWPDGGSM